MKNWNLFFVNAVRWAKKITTTKAFMFNRPEPIYLFTKKYIEETAIIEWAERTQSIKLNLDNSCN